VLLQRRCIGLRLIITCRISRAWQADEGKSQRMQRRSIAGYAMARGLQVDQTAVETGVPGLVPLGHRPQGKTLLDRLKGGDVVIITQLDRVFHGALDPGIDMIGNTKRLFLGGPLASSAAPEAVLALRIRGRLAQPEAQSATNGAVSQLATLHCRLRFASVSGSPHSRLGFRRVLARMASYSSYSHQNSRPRAGSRPSCRMASAEPFKRVVGMCWSMKRPGANAG
jgi:hypothetical protein